MTYLGSHILDGHLGANILTDALKKVTNTVTNKITGATGSGGSSLLSSATDAAANEAAGVVASNASYQVNRERFAVAAKTGYDWLDAYTSAKPTLFIVGIVGTLASGFGLYKRRKLSAETITFYSLTGIASLVLAIITKPSMGGGAAETPPGVAPASPGALKSVMAWADKKGAVLTAKSPGWEKATLTRVWNDVGQGPMQASVNTLLTKNSH